MKILGLFRCPLTDWHDKPTGTYNFIVRRIVRKGDILVWDYWGSYDDQDYKFSLPDVPLIRDLTEEETNKARSTPIPFREGDLDGYLCS